MARGWESKSVEAQQEDASRPRPKGTFATPEQRAREDRRRTLEMSRKRAVDDLARASAPAHRQMLHQAIASLEEQLAALQRS
jgi:hypothetical protein